MCPGTGRSETKRIMVPNTEQAQAHLGVTHSSSFSDMEAITWLSPCLIVATKSSSNKPWLWNKGF